MEGQAGQSMQSGVACVKCEKIVWFLGSTESAVIPEGGARLTRGEPSSVSRSHFALALAQCIIYKSN